MEKGDLMKYLILLCLIPFSMSYASTVQEVNLKKNTKTCQVNCDDKLQKSPIQIVKDQDLIGDVWEEESQESTEVSNFVEDLF